MTHTRDRPPRPGNLPPLRSIQAEKIDLKGGRSPGSVVPPAVRWGIHKGSTLSVSGRSAATRTVKTARDLYARIWRPMTMRQIWLVPS